MVVRSDKNKVALQVCAMSNNEPADIQTGANSSTVYHGDSYLNHDTNEELTKSTVVESNSSLKSFEGRKAREGNIKIAWGHQMFKNIESALNDCNVKKKSVERGRKDRQPLNRWQIRKMVLPSGITNSEKRKSLGSSVKTVDELISLFDLAVDGHCSMRDKFSKISPLYLVNL